MEKVIKVQMAADLENQGLARAIAAAYASELAPLETRLLCHSPTSDEPVYPA